MNQARRAPTMTIITNIAIELRKARQRQTLNRSIDMKLVFDSKKNRKRVVSDKIRERVKLVVCTELYFVTLKNFRILSAFWFQTWHRPCK